MEVISESVLEKLGAVMQESTKEFLKTHNIESMEQLELSTKASTVAILCQDGVKRKFAIAYFGLVDCDDIFCWADSIDRFSEYTRGICTEIRQRLESQMLLEATHYSLNVSDEAVEEARELYEDGGRYIIDENDALLSRLGVEELVSVIFESMPIKGTFEVKSGELTYYFGIVSALS
jgi:hypothetical protein